MRLKVVALSLAFALLIISAVTATLAYFQDDEFDKNTMTVGNVLIDQIENERDADGEIDDFTENKGMFPVTYNPSSGYNSEIEFNGKTYSAFANENNFIDKIVSVKNTGTLPAYVRTVFAFEMKKVNGEWVDPVGTDVMLVENGSNKATLDELGNISDADEISAGVGIEFPKFNDEYVTFELNGVKYIVGVYYYANRSILAAGEQSEPSLLQFYLKSHVGNEWYEAVGSTYDILAVSQAVQVDGFDNALEALNTAFGVVDSANCAQFFKE